MFCPVEIYLYFTRKYHWPTIELKFPPLPTTTTASSSRACAQLSLAEEGQVLSVQAAAKSCDRVSIPPYLSFAIDPPTYFAHGLEIMVSEPLRVSFTRDTGYE